MNDTQFEPPDEELLQRMRRKNENFPAAREAWSVFYLRHVQFLYCSVANADRILVGFAIGAEDIVEETFTKVWELAAEFSSPEGLDQESATLCCKAWLATIARNLVRDKLRSRKNDPIDPDENEALFTAPEAVEAVEQCLGLYQLVTRTLSERDAAIVWFKIGYYDPETGKSQPYRDAQDAFCKEWGITPDALRKAYERSLNVLREANTTIPRLH